MASATNEADALESAVMNEEASEARVRRAVRRSYTDEQRLNVVTECLKRGASVSGVSLRHGINANVVRKWIIRHRAGSLVKSSAMLPVVIRSEREESAITRPVGRPSDVLDDASEVRIEFGEIRIVANGAVHADVLSTAIRAVMGR